MGVDVESEVEKLSFFIQPGTFPRASGSCNTKLLKSQFYDNGTIWWQSIGTRNTDKRPEFKLHLSIAAPAADMT